MNSPIRVHQHLSLEQIPRQDRIKVLDLPNLICSGSPDKLVFRTAGIILSLSYQLVSSTVSQDYTTNKSSHKQRKRVNPSNK